MSERAIRNSNNYRNDMLVFYSVEKSNQGAFILRVDWLLENAVYPFENGYADNLVDLWNVYMPNYPFDKVVLEYSKNYYSVLRYIHDRELYRFKSVKIMQEALVKNYVKYLISQGAKNRMDLVKDCLDKFKDATDRKRIYDLINTVIDMYFPDGEIQQSDCIFLKRFQDCSEQPYEDLLERLTDIHDQKGQESTARKSLLKSLRIDKNEEEQFLTLINILLCKLASVGGEKRFSDALRDTWKETMPYPYYHESVYGFIDRFEKVYMNAACHGIRNIGNNMIVRALYKDAVILCTVLEAVEKGKDYDINSVNDFWKRDGMRFANGFFFDDEFERMKDGFNPEILIKHKNDIIHFHDLLIDRIKAGEFGSRREMKTASSEMTSVAINERERQIEDLQDQLSELEEKAESAEREVMSQFIALLDSKKYDHVLGKLYRIAYTEDEMILADIQTILKNMFEIMNISGIDVYGELGAKVSNDEVGHGRYRLDGVANGELFVKYPGYKIGDSVILHPLIEEK